MIYPHRNSKTRLNSPKRELVQYHSYRSEDCLLLKSTCIWNGFDLNSEDLARKRVLFLSCTVPWFVVSEIEKSLVISWNCLIGNLSCNWLDEVHPEIGLCTVLLVEIVAEVANVHNHVNVKVFDHFGWNLMRLSIFKAHIAINKKLDIFVM